MFGCRELACFLYHLFHLRAFGDLPAANEAMWEFYQSFNRVPADEYGKREMIVRVRSSERDWRRWVLEPESVRYNFSNEWIADKLKITKEEERELITLISTEETRRRDREYRRKKRGSVSRAEYEKERQKDKEHLIDLLNRLLIQNPNLKGKELAELLGVTPARVSQLKKELKN